MSHLQIKRRDALKGLLAISAAGALAACKKGGSSTDATALLGYASAGQFLSVEELAALGAIAQTIIPKTDTAGAIEAGVPKTLQELLSGWGDDNVRLYWRKGLAAVLDHLATKSDGADFAGLPKVRQTELLGAYDAAVYQGEIDDRFYKDMKATIATAYYMSEPGATEELIYDPVPGDFKGCVPYSEIGKAWAT